MIKPRWAVLWSCLGLLFMIPAIRPNPICQYEVVESIPENMIYNETTSSSYPDGLETRATHCSWSDLIRTAEREIRIASFYWTLLGSDVVANMTTNSSVWGEEILSLLLEATSHRNVSLQIVVNKDRGSDPRNNRDLAQLIEAGANVRRINFQKLVGAGILHTKFITVDGDKFYLGSANMDWRSLSQVKELGITVTECQVLTADLNKIFKTYWLLAESQTIPETWPDYVETTINKENPIPLTLNRTASTAYLSSSPKQLNPPDRTNDINAILDVIRSAKKFIYIAVMDYSPTFFYTRGQHIYWPAIDDALRRAAYERNVTIRVLASKWAHTRPEVLTFLKSLDSLSAQLNVEVKMFVVPAFTPEEAEIPFARVNHNKYMVTDEHVYIGTSNWSADYFVNTGGVSLTVRHEEDLGDTLRRQVQSVFSRDWTSSYALPISQFPVPKSFEPVKQDYILYEQELESDEATTEEQPSEE